MGSQAEYDRLCNERAQVERDKRDAEARKDNLEKQIERIKAAKKKLDSCYNSYESAENGDAHEIRDDYSWRGDTYNTFADMGDTLITNNRIYQKNIDRVRDAVNSERVKLENKLSEEKGLIGWLEARGRELGAAIDNFFNDVGSAIEDIGSDIGNGFKKAGKGFLDFIGF